MCDFSTGVLVKLSCASWMIADLNFDKGELSGRLQKILLSSCSKGFVIHLHGIRLRGNSADSSQEEAFLLDARHARIL